MRKDFSQTIRFFFVMQIAMVVVLLITFFILLLFLPPQREFLAIIAIFILSMGAGVITDFFLYPHIAKPAFFVSFTSAVAGLLALAPLMFVGGAIDHFFGWSFAIVCLSSVAMTSVKAAQNYGCSYLLMLLTHFVQVAAIFFPIYFTIL
ncbi:MAG TPA: hypothetical protein PKY08_02350 [Candidatus Magasanikbacteria bacterium]|nr:hypothetical protein [Candidatus Magasanikbacteria bacterium]